MLSVKRQALSVAGRVSGEKGVSGGHMWGLFGVIIKKKITLDARNFLLYLYLFP